MEPKLVLLVRGRDGDDVGGLDAVTAMDAMTTTTTTNLNEM